VDGEVVVRDLLTVTATVDHRFIDGLQGGVLARSFRRVFSDPWALDGLDGPPAATSDEPEATAKRAEKATAKKATAKKATAKKAGKAPVKRPTRV
jgi:hypothetical protein